MNSPKLQEVILSISNEYKLDTKKLNYWLKFFKNFHSSKENLHHLQSMLALYKNEDSQITLFGQLYGGKEATNLTLFDEKINFKTLIKTLVKLVKSKDSTLFPNSKKPLFKGILPNIQPDNEEKENFSIDPSELQQVRLKLIKRENYKGRKKIEGLAQIRGRIIGYSEKKSNNNPAILPTIQAALKSNHYNYTSNLFSIDNTDFRYPKKTEQIRYNVMLVLDSSKSIGWVIPHLEKLIPVLTSRVTQSKDSHGLITFNNDLAQIYHYPTRNVKQVLGTINQLEVKGFTPLGKGLELALQIFNLDRYKQPGMKNMILLISDCFPEPVTGGYKNLLEEPSYQMVINVAHHIRDSKTGMLIINPAPIQKIKNTNWGKKLANKIIDITHCRYIEIPPSIRQVTPFKQEFYMKQQQMDIFYNAFNETKFSL